MEFLKNNVCAVGGFSSLGEHVGIKDGKKDFAVIYSEGICSAAAVFTKNNVKGAPILVNMRHLAGGKAQAIVINSGIANVATSAQGIADAEEICSLAASELGIEKENVLVASTGIIGKRLPMDKLRSGMKGIKSRLSASGSAAEAIMTTDTVKKEIAIKSGGFTIGAIAKGSGMIHPNMATMLCFITTDANFSPAELGQFLASAVDSSFNMISVDGDTSTSDMAVILSSNKAEAGKGEFMQALSFVCLELAKKMAADGEGATKLIEATVKGAASVSEAKSAAKKIISSNLFKCAAFGNDPNWGRIMCALGNSGAKFEPEKVSISMQGKEIVRNGSEATDFDKASLSKLMKSDRLALEVDLSQGGASATAYGCDMSYEYVRTNADYHT